MFSCEFCEIFKNIFFPENLRTAASAYQKEGRRLKLLTLIQVLINRQIVISTIKRKVFAVKKIKKTF